MKRTLLVIILGIFMINMVLGFSICIDKTAPTWELNSSLTFSVVNNDVELEWTPAQDEPECSGIAYYGVYRGEGEGDLSFIGNSTSTSFLDEGLDYGTYFYMIHAYDKVGHNESNVSISRSITLEKPSEDGGNNNNGGTSSSGGSANVAGPTSFWQCGGWSECEDGIQTRVCEDLEGYEGDKIETKNCIPNYTPPLNLNDTTNKESEKQTSRNFLTGGVISNVGDFVKSGSGIITLTVIILLTVTAILFTIKRKKTKPKRKKKKSENNSKSKIVK